MTLEPGTAWLSGLPHDRGYSADEFAQLELPACPVCGERLNVQRLDVTFNAADEKQHGRTFIPGLLECPSHCNLMTRERQHLGWHVEYGIGGPVLRCSCGLSLTNGNSEEIRGFAAEHNIPREYYG